MARLLREHSGAAPSPRKHKYAAVAVDVCASCDMMHELMPWQDRCRSCKHAEAIRFPSLLEARRWIALRWVERQGLIKSLERQPRFSIEVNGIHICDYVGDFMYFRVAERVRVVEDAKGIETPLFRLKKRLVEAIHGVIIEVVKAP